MKRIISIILSVVILLSISTQLVMAVGWEDIYQIGDVNHDGKIDINDATTTQLYLAGKVAASSVALDKADITYDKKVNIRDATLIQLIVAKKYVPLVGKKGVDISAHNGNVDIQKIKNAGYDYVMIRCGFGDDYTSQDDTKFEANVQKCEAAGMPWGVYIYSYALTTAEAESEAAHVIRLLKGKKPTLPVAFDMEDADGYKSKNGMPTNATLVKICKTFFKKITAQKYYPILYANLNWINTKLNDSTLLNSYDIWLAQWNTECNYNGKTLGVWQYGGETNYLESNSIDGVGTIDKNFCYKDYPLIIKNGHYNNW